MDTFKPKYQYGDVVYYYNHSQKSVIWYQVGDYSVQGTHHDRFIIYDLLDQDGEVVTGEFEDGLDRYYGYSHDIAKIKWFKSESEEYRHEIKEAYEKYQKLEAEFASLGKQVDIAALRKNYPQEFI